MANAAVLVKMPINGAAQQAAHSIPDTQAIRLRFLSFAFFTLGIGASIIVS